MKLKPILIIVGITFVVRYIYGYLTQGAPSSAGGAPDGPLASTLPLT